MKALLLLALLTLAGCDRPAPPPAKPAAPLADRWWLAACGDIEPLQVGHDVTLPVAVHRVPPKWPDILYRTRIAGGVIIAQAVITDTGDVCAVRILRTFEGAIGEQLSAATVEALRQWKFQPATLHGKPRACVYALTVKAGLR